MELRHLVGERHRDIIEASDNILTMRQYSNDVDSKLSSLSNRLNYVAPVPTKPAQYV